jgi:hypothetical protein
LKEKPDVVLPPPKPLEKPVEKPKPKPDEDKPLVRIID